MLTLSICDGHNSSVALTKNGIIIFAIAEERLSRIKNHFGWPEQAIKYINENYVELTKIDRVILYRENVSDYLAFLLPEHFTSSTFSWLWKKTISRFSLKLPILVNNAFFQKIIRDYYARKLRISSDKIQFLNHHVAHAYAAFSEIDTKSKSWLHFVFDAEGDGVSTSVYKSEGQRLVELATCNRHNSLGHFYSQVTSFLGMKPNQHEFKVMGLEPYADKHSFGFKTCYEKFSRIISAQHGFIRFRISPATKKFQRYLKSEFSGQRFDNVAAAAQIILEDVVIDHVKYWMAKSNIQHISLSGGVAMNVKLMQRLYELNEVEEIYVVPSSGDESCVIGCSNYDSIQNGLTLTSLKNLYLGVKRDLDQEVRDLRNVRSDLEINYHDKIETEVANLLQQGYVVARIFGRDEFGARALGNRSILANPKDSAVIDLINKQVKNRDFWMPFTPSILDDKKDTLIINPRQYDAKYMNITFNSTRFAQEQLPAALHPWDKTVRPQFVNKEQNPSYYNILMQFYELTGCPGLLNTSFNLHGDPNVSSAMDALNAFDNSGLQYLQIGNYLIRKKCV